MIIKFLRTGGKLIYYKADRMVRDPITNKYKMIMKQISFILLFLFSLKCGAQNELKLFGTTLHFDSEVVCKLLYSQCPPENKSIKKENFIFRLLRIQLLCLKKIRKK